MLILQWQAHRIANEGSSQMTSVRLSQHEDSGRLAGRVRAILVHSTKLRRIVYRSTTPRFATQTDLVTGKGSWRHGGRFNPPGLAAVYASFTAETAMAETLATARYYGFAAHQVMPRTFVALSLDLRRTIDLSRGVIRRKLGVSMRRLLETDWRAENLNGEEAITQALGRLAAACRLEALLVPSATGTVGVNVIVFPGELRIASRIDVLNAGQLEG